MQLRLYPLAAAFFLLFVINASSTVRYVNLNSTNPTSPYTNWITAATNIQDGVDAATPSDTVLVTNGVYKTGGRRVSGSLSNRVVLDKTVTVQSVNGPRVTAIQGQGPHVPGDTRVARCAYLTSGASLCGFTLAYGATLSTGYATDFSGGGIWCESASAVVSNCVFDSNSATAYGGGAYQGTLKNCILSNNLSSYSGGGGAYCVLDECIVTNNASGAPGSGAYYCTLNNCLVVGNELLGHTNPGGSGAAYSKLNNCTVFGNLAQSSSAGGTLSSTQNNCIVYFNVANSGTTASNYSGGVFNYCCTTPLPAGGTGNFTNQPRLLNQTGAANLRLATNSPCINAGCNAFATGSTDLDGNPRIMGGTVDIGAYECQAPTSIISYAWLQQCGLPFDGTADLADTDGDGMNNWQEWIAGTNPTNRSSVLKLMTPVPTNNPSVRLLTWQSVSGKRYYLQRSTNLPPQPAFTFIQSNIVGQTGTTSFTDTNAKGAGPYFYRVGVQQ
jgi:hypothetical protein